MGTHPCIFSNDGVVPFFVTLSLWLINTLTQTGANIIIVSTFNDVPWLLGQVADIKKLTRNSCGYNARTAIIYDDSTTKLKQSFIFYTCINVHVRDLIAVTFDNSFHV